MIIDDRQLLGLLLDSSKSTELEFSESSTPDLKPYDFVVFRDPQDSQPFHVALSLGQGLIFEKQGPQEFDYYRIYRLQDLLRDTAENVKGFDPLQHVEYRRPIKWIQ